MSGLAAEWAGGEPSAPGGGGGATDRNWASLTISPALHFVQHRGPHEYMWSDLSVMSARPGGTQGLPPPPPPLGAGEGVDSRAASCDCCTTTASTRRV